MQQTTMITTRILETHRLMIDKKRVIYILFFLLPFSGTGMNKFLSPCSILHDEYKWHRRFFCKGGGKKGGKKILPVQKVILLVVC